ncbi:MAG: tetratricopeptide repeat protein [Planctomycetota bacterium]|nr:tetratricopeptide repeat protein [Planctomycetota bacterium]
MRLFASLAVTILLACGNLYAAMFGPFAVPEALRPTLHPTPGHGDRMAVIVPLSTGLSMVLYLPDHGEPVHDGRVLQAIGSRLDHTEDIHVFDLGGRPWFGTWSRASNNVQFFDGYVHKDGSIYAVAFSLDDPGTVTAEVRDFISRIGLYPGLRYSPAAPALANARDSLLMGDYEQAEEYMRHAESVDPDRATLHLLKGELLEADEEYDEALGEFARASILDPSDIDVTARYYGISAVLGDANAAITQLGALAAQRPDEAAPWEELGAIYLYANQIDVAISYYEQALMVDPTSETALFNLAYVFADRGDYANSYRRALQLQHYRPWIGDDQLPDHINLFGALAMWEIIQEPLPIGYISAYGPNATAIHTPQEIQIQTVTRYVDPYIVITRPQPRPIVSLQAVLGGIFDRFPSFGHRPHRPRPPSRPGAGGKPPNRPGSRPPSGGHGKPPSGGGPNRPRPPSEGGIGQPRPPSGGGSERPRPPSGGGSERPRPPSEGGIGQPRPPSGGGSERPRPPSGGGSERPSPPPGGESERPGPPSGGDNERPRPEPPAMTEPTPPQTPTTRPTPTRPERPSQERPQTRPTQEEQPAPERRPAERPQARPAQPQRQPQQEERPAPERRPTERPQARPAQPQRQPQQGGRPAPERRPAEQPQARPAQPQRQPQQGGRPVPEKRPAEQPQARPAQPQRQPQQGGRPVPERRPAEQPQARPAQPQRQPQRQARPAERQPEKREARAAPQPIEKPKQEQLEANG